MTDCPGCGQKGRHVVLKVPFDGRPSGVVHACMNDECRLIEWTERVSTSPEAVLAHIRSETEGG